MNSGVIEDIETLLVGDLFGPEGAAQFKSGELKSVLFERYIPAIRSLSEDYNLIAEGSSGGRILSAQEELEAYMLYFLPLNFVKVKALLERINLRAAKRILDFGCGPGSGSLAALAHLGGRPEIFLVDAASSAEAKAKELIFNYRGLSAKSLPGWRKERFDLIIAANSINELSPVEQPGVVKQLARCLNDKGVLVLLEPALKSKTRRAMELRDSLLESERDLTMLYPCTHNFKCPMLREGEYDWCHGFLSWPGSRLVRRIDMLTGFNKHRLKYSAFIFQKAAGEETSAAFRIVDNPELNKTGLKLKLCGAEFYGKIRLSKSANHDLLKKYRRSVLHDLFDEPLPSGVKNETSFDPSKGYKNPVS